MNIGTDIPKQEIKEWNDEINVTLEKKKKTSKQDKWKDP